MEQIGENFNTRTEKEEDRHRKKDERKDKKIKG